MTRSRHFVGQGDLFKVPHEGFPVRRPAEASRPVDMLRIKTALSQALKESPDSVPVIAAKIAEMTGREFSADALYSYTAPSKEDHDLGVSRLVALIRATGAFWLWDLLVEDDGLVVLEGREARLAELGRLQQEQAAINSAIRDLRRELDDHPVPPTNRVRRGRK